jgi:glycosyltransferase involved in cell wall biosynthesis
MYESFSKINKARTFEESCVDAKLSLFSQGIGLEDANLLAYYPRSYNNPFQNMLYSAGLENGFGCFSVSSLDDIKVPVVDAPLTIHYHWVHRVFNQAETSRDAAKVVANFHNHVDQLRDDGVQVLWTIHNLLSHRAKFPDEEIELRAGLAARADHVHIMNPATRELCAKYFEIEANKIFCVPHPSYHGVYGDYTSRAQARFDLGIMPEQRVLLLFGSVGRYKGAKEFLMGLDALEAELGERVRVLVAGAPDEADYMEEIYELASSRPNVTIFDHHIKDDFVHVLFRACDVVVCPYDIGLNSGVAATAATFGRPVVVPDILVPTMTGAEVGVVGFNTRHDESLNRAVLVALEAARNPATEEALAGWSVRNQPGLVSQRFFATLKSRRSGGI